MKLSLDALRTLEAIAEYGSFAGAANALHRVPSALTYTIQKLEADLGVRLFERSGRRAEPTAVGRALVEEARGLLQSRGAHRRSDAVIRSACRAISTAYVRLINHPF